MRFAYRAACLITAAISGLALMATAAAASTTSLQGTAQAAKGCITLTATIPVSSGQFGVAVNPKTNTIYAANYFSNTVSVISGRTNTITDTISFPANSYPYDVAANPRTNTIYVASLGSDVVSVLTNRRCCHTTQ
jgi:YVTN family beta-propeller protein